MDMITDEFSNWQIRMYKKEWFVSIIQKMDFVLYLFFLIVLILGTVPSVEGLFPKIGINRNGRIPGKTANKAGFKLMQTR